MQLLFIVLSFFFLILNPNYVRRVCDSAYKLYQIPIRSRVWVCEWTWMWIVDTVPLIHQTFKKRAMQIVGMENICITRICACNLCHNDKNNVMEYDYTVVMPMAFDILSPQRIITLSFGGVEWGTSNAIIIWNACRTHSTMSTYNYKMSEPNRSVPNESETSQNTESCSATLSCLSSIEQQTTVLSPSHNYVLFCAYDFKSINIQSPSRCGSELLGFHWAICCALSHVHFTHFNWFAWSAICDWARVGESSASAHIFVLGTGTRRHRLRLRIVRNSIA